VRADTDVAVMLDGSFASHGNFLGGNVLRPTQNIIEAYRDRVCKKLVFAASSLSAIGRHS
jgi:nucleoside-diphosphate-sugar epimerase